MLDGVGRWIWVRHWLGTPGCRMANLCVYGKTAHRQVGDERYGCCVLVSACCPGAAGIAFSTPTMFSAVNSPMPRVVFGMVVSGGGGVRFLGVGGCAQGGAVVLWGLWCAKLASNVLWRAVWLGELSCYGSKRAAQMSRPSRVVLPQRRLSQPDESCAITPFIAHRKASEQASGPAVDHFLQVNIFRLLKLEHAIFRHPPNRLLKGEPIYSGNWDTWFRLTCCAYLCSNPTGRKMAKMALFAVFEFSREVRVVMENVGK